MIPKCEKCPYLISTSYEYDEYDCRAGVAEEETFEFADEKLGCKYRKAALEKRIREIDEAQSKMYEGIGEWYEILQKAEMSCRKCRWFLPESERERDNWLSAENWCGKVGDPCWKYWEEHESPPTECDSFCEA